MSATASPGKRCQACETTENLSIGAFPAGAGAGGLAPGCRAAGWSAGFCWARAGGGLPARDSSATMQGAANRLANMRMEGSLAVPHESRRPEAGMYPNTVLSRKWRGSHPCGNPPRQPRSLLERISAFAFREQDVDDSSEICSAERRLLVLPVRIELTTSPLPRECSTTELRQPDSCAWMSREPGDPCHRATSRRKLAREPCSPRSRGCGICRGAVHQVQALDGRIRQK